MSLPEIKDPSDQEIHGWIVHIQSRECNYSAKAGALTAARASLGPAGMALLLQRLKLETAEDVVEWLAGK